MLYLDANSRPAWSDGQPLPFGTLTFYAENTHELLDVYDADSLSSTLTNPVVADSAGDFPAIWLDASLRYGVKLEDRYGRLVYHVPAYRTPVTEGAFQYLDAQIRAVDGDGAPIPGATLTLTDDEDAVVSGYADPECTIPHTNPVVADAGGLFPAIYLPDPVSDEPEIIGQFSFIAGEGTASFVLWRGYHPEGYGDPSSISGFPIIGDLISISGFVGFVVLDVTIFISSTSGEGAIWFYFETEVEADAFEAYLLTKTFVRFDGEALVNFSSAGRSESIGGYGVGINIPSGATPYFYDNEAEVLVEILG